MEQPFGGAFLFGSGWGTRPGRGWGGRRASRIFEKGDLKYVILDLIKEKPCHGYEIIRALEERFGGFYAPSPGAVYPTLQLLEDLGYVTVSEQDGKKVYTITPAGRQFLAERAEVLNDIHARFQGWWGAPADPDLRAVWRDLKEEIAGFGRLFAASATIAHQP
ncbi:MAG: PadR family transcriptional regulator, partial [Chloroflexi bacterium]|nr:PadR family transcriptional regulator [Chloroflexota bacterium]